MTTLENEEDIRLTIFIIASFMIISCLVLTLGVAVCMIMCKNDLESGNPVRNDTGQEKPKYIICTSEDIIFNHCLSELVSIDDLWNERFLF